MKEGAVGSSREDVEQAVLEVLREQLGFGPGVPIAPELDFYQDLGGDSLDYAEATMGLEDRLDVQVPDTYQPTRVGDIIEMLTRYTREPADSP